MPCRREVERDDTAALASQPPGGREGGFVVDLESRRMPGRGERRETIIRRVRNGARDGASKVVLDVNGRAGDGVVSVAEEGDGFLAELGGLAATDAHACPTH